MKTVLVTGANGHLGFTLTRALAERGYKVRAGVRDPGDARKTAPLRELSRDWDVEIVKAELTDADSIDGAVAGCDGVFHVAAVFDVTARNPDVSVRTPILRGIEAVLKACAKHKVGRLVYTSTTSAVGGAAPGTPDRDETYWNDGASEPYARAKTEAEKRAWLMAAELGLDMVAILPSAMLGPNYHRDTPTTRPLRLLQTGDIPVALPFGFNLVDVRDVAWAHILAFESPQAKGRYIAAGAPVALFDLFTEFARIDPGLKIPASTLPRAMLSIAPMLDCVTSTLTRKPRSLTRPFIQEYGYSEQRFSSDRLRTELGWRTRPLGETLTDMVEWLHGPGAMAA